MNEAQQEQMILAAARERIPGMNALAEEWSGRKYYGFRLNTASSLAVSESKQTFVGRLRSRFMPEFY